MVFQSFKPSLLELSFFSGVGSTLFVQQGGRLISLSSTFPSELVRLESRSQLGLFLSPKLMEGRVIEVIQAPTKLLKLGLDLGQANTSGSLQLRLFKL